MKTLPPTLFSSYAPVFIMLLSMAASSPLNAGQSALSILGLGLKTSPYNTREKGMGHAGMASVINKGFSIQNPSRTGFNRVTSFEAALETDITHLQDNTTSNRLTSARVPMIGGSFQLGPAGHFGISYFQQFEKNFTFSAQKPSEEKAESVEFEAGSYKIVFSLARSLSPKYAIGLNYQLLRGEDRQITSALFENEELIDLKGDTLTTKRLGGNFGFSFTYRHRKLNAAISASLPQKFEETKTRTIYLHPESLKKSRKFRLPASLAVGIDYKFGKHNHLVVDAATDDWDGNISPVINRAWQAGMGFEYQGLGNLFDAYYKKMAYRAGVGYQRLYLHEVDVLRLTTGLGLPLGKRGSQMDLAIELGRRGFSERNSDITEDYFKFEIALMGTGVWGRPSRRK